MYPAVFYFSQKTLTKNGVYKLQDPSLQKVIDIVCSDRNRQLCFMFLATAYGPESKITDLVSRH